MTERAFVDSNVFLYASDLAAGRKKTAARALLDDLESSKLGVVSSQVVNEFIVNAMQKLQYSPAAVLGYSEIFDRFEIVALELRLSQVAIEIHERYAINFWDALIVSAASSAGCRTLYTEDLSHGHKIAGVRIVDPFA